MLSWLDVDRVVPSLGHGIPADAVQPVVLAVHLQYADMVSEPIQQRSGERLKVKDFRWPTLLPP